MTIKSVFFAFLSVLLVSLLLFGKYKLASAKLTLPILFLGGLVFALSTPAQTAAEPVAQ
jgi:hypothetical protein